MKCIRCNNDANYRERGSGGCPKCKHRFVFEPKKGDKITDLGFLRAIDGVSSNGRVRFTLDNLYYEVCRKIRKPLHWSVQYFALGITVFLGFLAFLIGGPFIVFALVSIALTVSFFARSSPYCPMSKQTFQGYFERWNVVNGRPKGLIVKRLNSNEPREQAPDLADYSFDRAVICDVESTVDLLLGNNFHFENNCAILTADGYPRGPFETIRTMLKRNPKLKVFTLHDASPQGCDLAMRLRLDPDWFPRDVTIVDVGLRPAQSRRYAGFFQKATRSVKAARSISQQDAAWLNRYILELAVFRPEQTLKRLFRAIHNAETNSGGGDGGSVGDGGSSGSSDTRRDECSMGDSDVSDTDSDFDSFG